MKRIVSECTYQTTRVLAATTLIAVFSSAIPAYASSVENTAASRPQFYVGGGIGYGRINGEDFTNTNGDLSKSRVSWDAMVGVKFNPIVSLESQYIDFGAANRGSDRVKAHGFTAGVVLDIPLSKFITPYGKAGALFWKTDETFNNISRDDSGTGFNYGVGVRFMVSDNIDIRTEYMRYKLDTTHVDNIAANIQFNF